MLQKVIPVSQAKRGFWFVLVLVILFQDISRLLAQTVEDESRRNTVKIDLTSHFLYRNPVILSYERVTKPNQSFAISAGYNQFPQMVSLGDDIRTTEELKRTGFKIGGEYRFYLPQENKFRAPRGVYIGPYASYLDFTNERNIEVTSEGGEIRTGVFGSDISVVNIGFQLGYQFVLNNRWTIDLVFVGPSVSHYSANLRMDGDFNIDEEELLQNEIIKRMISRFPMLDDFIRNKEVDADGSSSSWAYGYRYQFLVGYHFGRRK